MKYRLLLAAIIAIGNHHAFAAGQPENIVYTCKTPKHIILIDTTSADTYRYRAWNLPKSTSQKPDMVVQNGTMNYEGTGVCGSNYYTFKTGNVEFNVDDSVACTEERPPKDAIGSLYVRVSGEEKNHYYCFK